MTDRHSGLTCWCCPADPWPADTERWQAFCAEIDDRIALYRTFAGFDSRRGQVATAFDRPLPPDRPRPAPATWRTMRIPTTPRAANGRWESGGLLAS